jgi:hypothetical protein
MTIGIAVMGTFEVPAVDKPVYTFGMLKPLTADEGRAQAEQWFQNIGKNDPTSQQALAAIWADADKSASDRVTATLVLGVPDAAKLLADAADPDQAAPKEVPPLLKNAQFAPFFRANLAVAYARALTSKRVYEEALECLKLVKPEQTADPASYFFHRAVAEHALMLKDAAGQTIVRLLDDVSDSPDRYKMVATLMYFDMQSWKKDEKDLGNISRMMENIERRLDLSRGGKQTQELQKKVLFRLDELIKQKENEAKQCSQANGGSCPNGGQPKPGGGQGAQPQLDSFGGNNTGPGNITEQKLKQYAEVWGKLPEKERAKAMMEVTRDLPPRYREVIENYFRTLSRTQKQP